MREEESTNWFSKWEEQLPPPDDLIPLSQSLITPHLAIAFDILNPNNTNNNNSLPPPPPPLQPPSLQHNSGEFHSAELGCEDGAARDEPARTLKRPRLVWTPQLHKRFVDAVAHLGMKNAVPKTIMQLMSVDGLTRENVASHLQKYRLYLKRMQGISTGGVGGLSPADVATDHLFASSPVPAHFLHQGRNPSEHYLPFVPVEALQHHQHQQMAAAAAVAGHQQYNRHFGSSPNSQQYEHPFLARQSQQQQQQQVHRIGTPVPNSVASSYVEDLEAANAAATANGRKVLTLFPTGDD